VVTRRLFSRIAIGLGVVLGACTATAQVTPTAGYPPPDDTPSVRVGGTLFLDYTRTIRPQITDANGTQVSPSAFNVPRAYINVTGQVNHLIAFRITPDITREGGTGSSLAGSMTLRLKYGYAQLNLEDWMWRGTYIRGGMIQTPYVEFEESVYRYRFQGPVFADREGFLTSADVGLAFRAQSPSGRAEIFTGFYRARATTAPRPTIRRRFKCAQPFARSWHQGSDEACA
jgi:hypothetical protein